MQYRIVDVALAGLLGVLCTTATASAQETGLASARDQAKSHARSAEASLAYGRALRRAGHETEALAELRRAAGLAAGHAELSARAGWEIARTHIAKREFQAALGTCRSMEKTAGAASHVCAAEAHLLWRRGTEATAELAEVPKAKDGVLAADVRYYAKLAEGRVHELESSDAAAEASFREALALAPNRSDAHVRLGVVLLREDKDGVASLRKAVELDPHDPVALLALGEALPEGSGEALGVLERAVAERPTSTDALRALASGYVAARRLPDAKKTAEAVLKLAPSDVLSHVIAGRVALAEGKTDVALREGEAASKLMPNAAPAKLLVADAYAKKGEIDLATEAYQAAFGLDHSSPAPLVNAAEACVAAGRPTTAKAFARRATQDFASHAPAWVALGDALVADKDPAAARSAYETAKKTKGADLAVIDQKLARLK
jgi:tetratricopeptide (TPR) repeat protein